MSLGACTGHQRTTFTGVIWVGAYYFALNPSCVSSPNPQGKMGKIHTRLGRVEANPNIFNTGPGPMGGDPGGAGKNLFDVDFTGGM